MNPFNPLKKQKFKDKTLDSVKNNANRSKRFADNVIDAARKFRMPKKLKIVLLSVFATIGIFLLSVYIPSWLSAAEQESYYSLAYDPKAVDFTKTLHLGEFADADFDNDGVTNKEEYNEDTDMFSIDTDHDGYSDAYEIQNDMDPLKEDDLSKYVKQQGKSLDTPYSDEGVILWPDDYSSKAYGYVIKDMTGYYIKNFKGWAQFPDSLNSFVYSYKDGICTELKYRETENAYYIKEDSYIIVLNDEVKYSYTLTAFGNNYTLDSRFWGSVLSFILPSKGNTYLKCSKAAELPFDTRSRSTAPKTIEYNDAYEDRLTQNTNSLNALSSVFNMIDKGKCVYVSIYKPEEGESIGVVYGYENHNALLIADPKTGSYAGKLHISLKGANTNTPNGMIKRTWFEFEGLGFNSENGDRICFFGSEADKDYVDILS